MGYCHCRSCRSWSGGPINAFSLWNPAAVSVTDGEENLATYVGNPASERKYCKKCGGHLMTNHPGLGLVDVFTATIPSLNFQPGVHVNYQETVLPMKDGLPKFRDFPGAFGGSDQTMPE
ncbi:MAG TPA: GFA family protein [Caulobacteraceae bacterium]|nr:GFA family protein [Caulobacteraceae bacterium]